MVPYCQLLDFAYRRLGVTGRKSRHSDGFLRMIGDTWMIFSSNTNYI